MIQGGEAIREDIEDIPRPLRSRVQRLRRHTPPDLVHSGGGEVVQHLDLGLPPLPRLGVDEAEGAQHLPISRAQRNAGVGDDPQLRNGEALT